MKKWTVLVMCTFFWGSAGLAQATGNQEPAKPDAPSVASQTNAAWDLLNTAVAATKREVQQARIDAISALGTLGDFPHAVDLLRAAQKDQDRHIRLAAVAAMGSSKKAIFIPDLKRALDDSAAEVSFSAAVGLWKMNDRSGESILSAVVAGDRKAKQGAIAAEKHQADQDLHSPSKLALIGAEQGAYAVLGPFGYGLSAIRRGKGDNGISARTIAVTLLAEDKSTATEKSFVDAMDDPDPAIRAAAARALGDYHSQDVLEALGEGFYDNKPQVKMMAAASYIRAAHSDAENTEHTADQHKHASGRRPVG
jgi:HEAT repeat protein